MTDIGLHVDNINTTIVFSDDMTAYYRGKVRDLLKTKFKARPEGYRYMTAYRHHKWDGFVRLFKHDQFPSGLLQDAVNVLESNSGELGYTVEVFDTRERVEAPTRSEMRSMLTGITLRDYQLDAIENLLAARTGVAQMATNSGKTAVIAAITKIVNGRSLILTHKKELLYQIADMIKEHTGIAVGLIGDGLKNTKRTITVAMVQSLHSMIDTPEWNRLMDGIVCLMIDEVHHVSAQTMYETVMHIPAPLRFGFSGTPLKYDDLSDLQLIASTGPIAIHVNNEQLISEGYSSTPVILSYMVDNPETYKAKEHKYQFVYDTLIVNNDLRNGIIAERAFSAFTHGFVVLILVERIEHQELLAQLIYNTYKHPPVIMNGSQTMEYRNDMLNIMREGWPEIFIATEILGEGVNVPALDVVILAGGGKSHIRLLQRIGRGMRKKVDRDKFWVVDFRDTGKYIEKHAKKRHEIYEAEGFEIKELTWNPEAVK